MHSPILKYCDLVKYQSDYVKRLHESREIARRNGVTYFTVMNRNIEIAERILSLLKHSQKEMQADLFDKNIMLNHK